MAVYEYKCRECGMADHGTTQRPERRCKFCGGEQKRVYSFRMAHVMQEHWSDTIGGYVSDRRKFKSALRQKSDEMTERTGIPHDYQPIDPDTYRDRDAMKVTSEGLDSTYNRRVAAGLDGKTWLSE